MSYDHRCSELAEAFLCRREEAADKAAWSNAVDALAEAIQATIEDWLRIHPAFDSERLAASPDRLPEG